MPRQHHRLYLRSTLPSLLLASVVALIAGAGQARTIYVDTNNAPSAHADGLAPTSAFKTIQEAADQVRPGDTVIVAPGVYFETVQLSTAGTDNAPITFKTDGIAPGRVTVTGANQAIRLRQVEWKCVDAASQLYSIRAPSLRQPPSRILYSGTDLFPYPSLEELKKFELNYPSIHAYPGPDHGFAWELSTRTLYVRLHASGRYGPPNPNDHLMAIAPINGAGGGPGMTINRPEHYNFGILSPGPAHVILDGFTFETPGVAGVFIGGSGHVTVRNSWFIGCRTGVSGRRFYNGEADYTQTTNNVVIEYSDYHCFPAFNDMREVIERPLPLIKSSAPALEQRIYWWHRKEALGYTRTYETGIANAIGSDWTIRNSRIHDTMDGLSMWATSASRNLKVYNNRFERLIDNAVEAENHAINLHVYQNLVIDVFEPFSWQPLGGTPWPGPFYVYDNLVITTPPVQGLWKNAGRTSGRPGWVPGVFKIGAHASSNWNLSRFPHMAKVPDDIIKIPDPGMLVWNNTIYSPGSRLLARVGKSLKYEDIIFERNFIEVDDYNGSDAEDYDNGMIFRHNTTRLLASSDKTGTSILAKTGTIISATGFRDVANNNFSTVANQSSRHQQQLAASIQRQPVKLSADTNQTSQDNQAIGSLLAETQTGDFASFPAGPRETSVKVSQ